MKSTKPKKKKAVLYILIGAVLGISLALGAGFTAFNLRGKIPRDKSFKDYVRFGRHITAQMMAGITDIISRKRSERKEKGPSGVLELVIYPDQEIRKISPLIYGSNLTPKTEFEMDVAKFGKEVGITNFRFPGGASEGYRWKLGTFDFSDRYNQAPLSKIQNVIKYCDIVGAKIIIQINMESGTPQEAAEWVKYMNKGEGVRVDYWELGNEVFGDWDKAYMSGKKYAQLIKQYSSLMKAVDPTIKVGADWGGAKYEEFDRTVIKEAANYIDFVSYHWYPNHIDRDHKYKGRNHPLPGEIMANSLAVQDIVKRAEKIIDEYAPHRNGKIEFTIMEWDGSWDAVPSDLEFEYKGVMWSLANAIFFADSFGQFARHGVTVANQYCFQEVAFGLIRGWDRQAGWGGSRWDGETIRPKALAMKMFARHFGDILVESRLAGSPAYYKERDWRPDSYTGEVPYIAGYASKSSRDNTIVVVLTNKHAKKDFAVNISIKGVDTQEKGYAWILNGESLKMQNDGNPGAVKIVKYHLSGVAEPFIYNVPAHSVSLLEIPVKKEMVKRD